ncbi:MAG TPA: histone deacetylase [Candidatus Obscuribacterales bacterium]
MFDCKSQSAKGVALVYDRRYNLTAFGLERLHPFDGKKYAKIQQSLIDLGLRTRKDFISPQALSHQQLLLVHSPEYLGTLRNSATLAEIFEVPVAERVPNWILNWRILRPMRIAAGGTLLACRLALEHGVGINIGGGYHHADGTEGGGFCIYTDVPIALQVLHAEGKVQRALIVDTDAHQGNGFANTLRGTGWAAVLDFFDEAIFPYPKVDEDMPVPLPARTGRDYYLEQLHFALPEAIRIHRPDLIVYNAGSDVLDSDPLSTLRLTQQDMQERDVFVVSTARKARVPIAMVLSGGYGPESAEAHALSIRTILTNHDGDKS